MSNETGTSPVVKAARNLSAIEDAYTRLRARAIDQSAHRLMPGGPAMVALAGAGLPDEWAEIVAAEELHHYSTCPKSSHKDCRFAEHVEDEDGWEPPLQTLLFWSEQWRAEHGYPLSGRPTIVSEARFIRWALNWAWDNETHWDDFARDLAACRTRLENVLHEGARAERGVPCLYETCKGARLVRKLVPYRDGDGYKMWRHSDWHCPRCKRSWNESRYLAMVTAAHERTKFEEIDGEIWGTTEYVARVADVPHGTVRSWLSRGELESACIVAGRRQRFVRLAEVETRAAERKPRKRMTTV